MWHIYLYTWTADNHSGCFGKGVRGQGEVRSSNEVVQEVLCLQNWREEEGAVWIIYAQLHMYACGLPISQLLLLIHIGAWHHTLHHLPEASKSGTGEDDNEKYAGTPGLHHWKEVHEAPGAVGQYSGVVYHACYNILLLIVHVQLCRHIFYNHVHVSMTEPLLIHVTTFSAEKVCEGRLFRLRARWTL